MTNNCGVCSSTLETRFEERAVSIVNLIISDMRLPSEVNMQWRISLSYQEHLSQNVLYFIPGGFPTPILSNTMVQSEGTGTTESGSVDFCYMQYKE